MATAVIPARFGSTRLPGKPLLRATGKYLVQHVCERVAAARSVDRVIVATDDRRIREAVESFGVECVMTREDHATGTDRVAEVARALDADLIVNVQGDEPEIDPLHLDALMERMLADEEAAVGTLCCPFPDGLDPRDANKVKVVLDCRQRALYFSRALIPFPREAAGVGEARTAWRLHVGVYAYRRERLLALSELPQTPLEEIERLEQLRALYYGLPVAVVDVEAAAPGVDTPDDYAAFVERMGHL